MDFKSITNSILGNPMATTGNFTFEHGKLYRGVTRTWVSKEEAEHLDNVIVDKWGCSYAVKDVHYMLAEAVCFKGSVKNVGIIIHDFKCNSLILGIVDTKEESRYNEFGFGMKSYGVPCDTDDEDFMEISGEYLLENAPKEEYDFLMRRLGQLHEHEKMRVETGNFPMLYVKFNTLNIHSLAVETHTAHPSTEYHWNGLCRYNLDTFPDAEIVLRKTKSSGEETVLLHSTITRRDLFRRDYSDDEVAYLEKLKADGLVQIMKNRLIHINDKNEHCEDVVYYY